MSVRYEIRPLGAWTDPVTDNRQSASVFRATWNDTLRLLRFEAGKLDAELIVLQVDVTEADLRQDGMLRSRAVVGYPGVVVTLDSRHGPLRYATDAYEQRWQGGLTGWQANVRAIALTLVALRATDRYGVTKRGEQYTGWKQLPAGPNGSGFATETEAVRWMTAKHATLGLRPETELARMYRQLAAKLHPDVPGSGDHADWHRLDQAKQVLVEAGRLR